MYKRRLEDEVLENVSFEQNTPRFFGRLTPRELVAVVLVADGMSQAEIADTFGVKSQTIQKRIASARDKAAQVFGREALEGRSDPRGEYRTTRKGVKTNARN